jgi:peptide/nickel transport system permease protein
MNLFATLGHHIVPPGNTSSRGGSPCWSSLTVAATLGPGLYNAMIAVGVAWIPSFARIVRSSVLQIKETTYVEAARARGASDMRLISRHILPNTLAAIMVLASLGVTTAILVGAALSFLGVGASPPTGE